MADGPYTYYVDSVAGVDGNPGTQALPWKTITKVNATLAASQSVGFKRGTTTAGKLTPVTGVTYGAWGTGANPIINGAGQTQCIAAASVNNLVVQDLRLTGATSYGLVMDIVTGLTITNLEVDHNGDTGIFLGNGTNTATITGCSVHDNGSAASGDRDGIGIGGGGAAPHHITISGCDINANWHDGIRVAMTSGFQIPHDIVITNNTVRNSTTGSGIAADACNALTITFNVVTGCAGVGIYTVPASDGTHIENVQSVIYHNTVVGNLWGMQTTNGGGGTFNVIAKNNLLQNNGTAPGSSAEMGLTTLTTWVSDYNLVYHAAGGNFMYPASFGTWAQWLTAVTPNDSHSKNVNPLLNLTDYTLQAGSPALGAGVFIAGVSLSNPPDIGAKGLAVVATPTVDVPSGTYAKSVTVAIATATPGATICYRTDGVDPAASTPGTCSAGSTTYTVPVVLNNGATLKAIGTKAANANSGILTQTYVIKASGIIAVAPPFQSLNLAAGVPVQIAGGGGGSFFLSILNTGPGNLYISSGATPGVNAQSLVVPALKTVPLLLTSAPVWLSVDQSGGVSIAAIPR